MMRFTPGTAAGPAWGVGWRPILRSGGGALAAGPCAVRSTETAATPGSAATAASAAARVGSSFGALGGIDLEQEAHAVALDRERADHVGIDEAAAGAGHRHRGERGEDGFTGHGHRRSQRLRRGRREARKRVDRPIGGGWQGAAARRRPRALALAVDLRDRFRACAGSENALRELDGRGQGARCVRAAPIIFFMNNLLTAMHHVHGGVSGSCIAESGGGYLAVHNNGNAHNRTQTKGHGHDDSDICPV